MKRKIFIAVITAVIPCIIFAQSETETDTLSADPKKLNEVVVYANKFPELAKYITQSVKVIKDRNTLNLQANTADILINTGSVFVQKSQQGGGSPVIRGFEASRVLLMVDGVRMNNAIYRSGHLQNIITIDNMVLDRMEVLYGPSSTLYGSDALGGVVSMYTRNPTLSKKSTTQITGSTTARYSSAMEEARGNFILNIGGKKWGSLTSVTYGSFGDMRQGSKRLAAYPNFGLKDFIVQRSGNTDIIVANPDPNKQSPSGYKQVDITQKFLYQQSANVQHIFNFQFSNTNDLPRYDRLTEKTGANPVFAEWYYGPQLRNLAAYNLNITKMNGFFQDMKITTSYQDLEESRITRRFNNNNNRDTRVERINVFGANIDLKHYSGRNEIHIGSESYVNFVNSVAERNNIVTNAKSKINTRYPDGFNKMSNYAVYAQHIYKINDRWTLSDGLRLNYVYLNSKFIDTSILHFPFTKATQSNYAITGNLGLVYNTQKDFRLAFLLSSGFRNPNIDDLGKVFDSQNGVLIVPNTNIKPEYTYNAEINLNQYGKNFSYGASIFYTWFRNAIVQDAFTFNGSSNVVYNGVLSQVVANQNKAKASLYGFSVNGSYTFLKKTSIEGAYTYTYGRFTNNGITVPLDHVPPAYGRVAVKHTNEKWNASFFTLFNGWKRIKDYNPFGEDNQQYATVDGMPSWLTLNISAAITVKKNLYAQLLIDNLLDRNYRYFASGFSAAGRNIVLSLKASF